MTKILVFCSLILFTNFNSTVHANSINEAMDQLFLESNILTPSGKTYAEEIAAETAKVEWLNGLFIASNWQVFKSGYSITPKYNRGYIYKVCMHNTEYGLGHPAYLCTDGSIELKSITGGKYNVKRIDGDELTVIIETVYDKETSMSIEPKELRIFIGDAIFTGGCSFETSFCVGDILWHGNPSRPVEVVGIYSNSDPHVLNPDGEDYRLRLD